MIKMLFNPWVLLALAVFMAGAFGYGYHIGSQSEVTKTNNEKMETIDENITIRKEQDKIIRADDAVYINRLRERTI